MERAFSRRNATRKRKTLAAVDDDAADTRESDDVREAAGDGEMESSTSEESDTDDDDTDAGGSDLLVRRGLDIVAATRSEGRCSLYPALIGGTLSLTDGLVTDHEGQRHRIINQLG